MVKLELRFNMDKEGMETLFKPYQIRALKVLEKVQPAQTIDVWTPIKDEISRASVINFLQDMAVRGYLNNSTETGKGGRRPVYTLAGGTVEETIKLIKVDLMKKIMEELP